MSLFDIVDIKISRKALIGASGIFTLLIAATVWFVVLGPIDRCLTNACREAVREADLDAAEDEWAPVLAQSQAELDRATREVEQTKQNIRDADRALATLECQKAERVC